MVEIIEVKDVVGAKGSGPGATGNIQVNTLQDLEKLSDIYHIKVIFKKEKEYYFFHDGVVYRYYIEEKWQK
ncbi:hypothetical protein FJY84_05130 [Candidatus Bathyarchaeota archaeon]|nr:hypothetical protein [Candidatus Bathyarchaeota archaeon]